MPSNPGAGTYWSAGRPDGPTVSVTSPMSAPPTTLGGVNEPIWRASRSGSTSLSNTSITTGVPGPVSAWSSPPMGGLFVASTGSNSTTTEAESSVPFPSTIV